MERLEMKLTCIANINGNLVGITKEIPELFIPENQFCKQIEDKIDKVLEDFKKLIFEEI